MSPCWGMVTGSHWALTWQLCALPYVSMNGIYNYVCLLFVCLLVFLSWPHGLGLRLHLWDRLTWVVFPLCLLLEQIIWNIHHLVCVSMVGLRCGKPFIAIPAWFLKTSVQCNTLTPFFKPILMFYTLIYILQNVFVLF